MVKFGVHKTSVSMSLDNQFSTDPTLLKRKGGGKVNKLPAFGLWENKPQQPLEAQEEMEKGMKLLDNIRGFSYICDGETSYQCVINRRRK